MKDGECLNYGTCRVENALIVGHEGWRMPELWDMKDGECLNCGTCRVENALIMGHVGWRMP